MQEDIRIRMPVQPERMVDLYAAQHKPAALHQTMDVVSVPDPHPRFSRNHVAQTCCALRQSSEVVILKLSVEPATR